MKKIKLLVVKFNNELSSKDISAFRGAVNSKLENPDILYHHHIGKKEYLYRYPLIQYKTINKKATIVAIDKGTEVIGQFLSLDDWDLNIGDKTDNMSISDIKANQFVIQAWDKYFNYKIRTWLPLNEKNYSDYKLLSKESEKIYFLENILRGNILSFGKGIGCLFEREIKLGITGLIREKTKVFKNTKMHAVDADFKTNVFLPNYIGLGKGVSIGFGNINTIK